MISVISHLAVVHTRNLRATVGTPNAGERNPDAPRTCLARAASRRPFAQPPRSPVYALLGSTPCSKTVYEPPAVTRPSFAIFSSPPRSSGKRDVCHRHRPALQPISHTPVVAVSRIRPCVSRLARIFQRTTPRPPFTPSPPSFETRPTGFDRRRCGPTASKSMAKRRETKANAKETLKLPSIFRSKSNDNIVFYVRF